MEIDYVKYGPLLPNGAFSEYDMEAIYPAIKKLKKGDLYVEVGVMHGRSLAWAGLMSEADIVGIDRNHVINLDWFKEHKRKLEFIHKPSNEAVKDWNRQIDLLFIDGDHTYEGCLDDWNNFSPFVKSGGTVYFHDCDETSPGVVQVFQEIGEGWTNKIIWKDEMDGRKTSMASVTKL